MTDLVVHPDNALYGHRTVLNRYLGRADRTPMLAHIQHGWSWTTPVLDRRRAVRHAPILAWSERNACDLRSLGLSKIIAIGAPLLYLPESERPRPDRAGTVALPSHSWRGNSLDDDDAAIRFADELVERYGSEVTVLVHATDLRRLRVLERYRHHGFETVAGAAGHGLAFLLERRDLLRRAETVVSNLVSTGVFYGGVLGAEIEVFGPVESIYGPEYARRMAAYQRVRWPELTAGGLRGSMALELARQELGADVLRSRDELGRLVPVARRHAAVRYAVAYHTRRALVVADRWSRGVDPNEVRASAVLDRELARVGEVEG